MAFSAAARIMLGMEIDSMMGIEMAMLCKDFLSNIMSIPFDVPGFGFHRVSGACWIGRLTAGNLQNMKPLQICTGFIFCTFPASVTAND